MNGVNAELRKKPYFHGLITREDTADFLKKNQQFLLRVTEPVVKQHEEGSSAAMDQFVVISVMFEENRGYEGIKHYVIRQGSKGFHCERHEYDSIPLLVDDYVLNGLALDRDGHVNIKHPVPRRKWELEHSVVRVDKKLGEGAYGEVCKGELLGANRQPIAIKKALMGSLTKDQIKEVMTEARTMRNNQHPNIIRLIGVAALEEPLYIVMELASNGSLDSYLKKNREHTDRHFKTNMCEDLAWALGFLADREILHRDIAARNCLLFDTTVKLSDFGKSQPGPSFDMDPKEKLPIRWLSPETMEKRKFDYASEVWSFGITCWEIFSDGQEPYTNMTVREVNHAVLNNHRMAMPESMSEDVKRIVWQCWKDVDHRPNIGEVIRQFGGITSRATPGYPQQDNDNDGADYKYVPEVKPADHDSRKREKSVANAKSSKRDKSGKKGASSQSQGSKKTSKSTKSKSPTKNKRGNAKSPTKNKRGTTKSRSTDKRDDKVQKKGGKK